MGGKKGQMHIIKGAKFDTVIVPLASRGETISKPIVLYFWKNNNYNMSISTDMVSSLSSIHYNFKTIKQLIPIMQADSNAYFGALFARENITT